MQAGFPVAPQAPVATQPRQMVQPLPTGTERTPGCRAAIRCGARECDHGNEPSADQATPPAAQSAASAQRIPGAGSSVTANATSNAVPMPGLPLASPTGAEPAAERTQPSASLRSRAAAAPSPRGDQAMVPTLIAGASGRCQRALPSLSRNRATMATNRGRPDSRRATGDAPRNRVADISVQTSGAKDTLLPEPQSTAATPRDRPIHVRPRLRRRKPLRRDFQSRPPHRLPWQ